MNSETAGAMDRSMLDYRSNGQTGARLKESYAEPYFRVPAMDVHNRHSKQILPMLPGVRSRPGCMQSARYVEEAKIHSREGTRTRVRLAWSKEAMAGLNGGKKGKNAKASKTTRTTPLESVTYRVANL